MSKVSSLLKGQKLEIKNIIRKVMRRDFSGYSGLAIKNSLFQFLSSSVAQIGSLLFTIIMARILLPEIFGLYSLALSTIILFATFSDMSTGTTVINFVSSALGKKKFSEARSYFVYLLKIRVWLTLSVSFILLISAKFIANNYYQKPLFLALIAGCFYILFSSMVSFADSLYKAANNFKFIFFKEIFFQAAKLLLVPLATLISLKSVSSYEINVFAVILALTLSQLIALLFFVYKSRTIDFLKSPIKKIKIDEKKRINKFMIPLSATALSGVFFGYIDLVMLGKFVSVEFIGFYRAAFSIVGTIIPIIAFSSVLFPIFGRLKGKRLEDGFKKSVGITITVSLLIILVLILVSPFAIGVIFGKEYSAAAPILQILAITIFFTPLIDLYTTYLSAKGKTMTVAKLLITATILNIILNYIFITWFLSYSQFMAVIGAAIATIISRLLLLMGLIFSKKA